LVQALNTTSASQCGITSRATIHTPLDFSTSIPVQLRYPEVNINGDATVTWDMTTTYDAKACQINEHSLHTVENNNSHARENNEQYVVWGGSGSSLIRPGLGQGLSSPILRHSTSTPKRTTHPLVSSTGRAQPASRWPHTSHSIPTFQLELMTIRLLLVISILVGPSLIRVHP
jgi:hypothetical protein